MPAHCSAELSYIRACDSSTLLREKESTFPTSCHSNKQHADNKRCNMHVQKGDEVLPHQSPAQLCGGCQPGQAGPPLSRVAPSGETLYPAWRWAGCLTPPWRQGRRRAPSSQPASSCREPSGPSLDTTLRLARPPSLLLLAMTTDAHSTKPVPHTMCSSPCM